MTTESNEIDTKKTPTQGSQKTRGDQWLWLVLLFIIGVFSWAIWKQYQISKTMLAAYSTYNDNAEKLASVPQQLGVLTQRMNAQQQAFADLQEQVLDLQHQQRQQHDGDMYAMTLNEAYALTRLAEQKLWLLQDVAGASYLLKKSDQLIADLKDPGLRNIRQALAQDREKLNQLIPFDHEGLILRLKAITREVNNSKLNAMASIQQQMQHTDVKPQENDSWRTHLQYNWHQFMQHFISIRRHDQKINALLSEQSVQLLKQNIHSLLIQAQLAVNLSDKKVYISSLQDVIALLTSYALEPSTYLNHLVPQLQALSAVDITKTAVPALNTIPLLKDLIQAQTQG